MKGRHPVFNKPFTMIHHDIRGSLAQLVEQRPEEPCVPSSSLGGATKKNTPALLGVFFLSSPLSHELDARAKRTTSSA